MRVVAGSASAGSASAGSASVLFSLDARLVVRESWEVLVAGILVVGNEVDVSALLDLLLLDLAPLVLGLARCIRRVVLLILLDTFASWLLRVVGQLLGVVRARVLDACRSSFWFRVGLEGVIVDNEQVEHAFVGREDVELVCKVEL